MTKTPAIRGLLAGFVLLAGSVTPALAQPNTAPKRTPPTTAQMLDPRLAPKHDDVDISIPAPNELGGCTVVQVFGQTQAASGWVLKDAKGQPLRRFFDSTGRGNVDSWSYYKDGIEVYREFDTTGKGSPNNFRWLNAGGMKWGVGGVDPKTSKAIINAWRMISAEEVGFEAYQALAKQDYARLQILFVTEAELAALKLPAAKIKLVATAQQQAPKKFGEMVRAGNWGSLKFEDVEATTPHCDTSNDGDIILYPNRQVRYVAGKDERKWIHTGEMIQVGMAWKLVDAPSTQEQPPIISAGRVVAPREEVNPELQKLLDRLTELDKNPPPIKAPGAIDKNVDTYLRERIGLVQKIVAVDKADQREGWYKQLFDNLMALAQNNCDDATLGTLKKMSDDVAAQVPGSNLAGYGAYRYFWTVYAVDMVKADKLPADKRTKEITAVQDRWLENLAAFVQKYKKADDTPEALYQLGNGCEFGGKIEEAKRWYSQLGDGFPNHHLAPRAKGCAARLNLVGNRLELVAPLLNDANKAFDVNQLKGKLVIVHYWSSQSDQFEGDFRKLKRLLDDIGTKQNVELVSVSLDDSAVKAKEAVAKSGAPGIHLYQAPPNNSGGSNSPLAIQYGIHILPTVFIVDRAGRVDNNAVQVADVETALKKVQ